MTIRLSFSLLAAAILVSACQSGPPPIDQLQPNALTTAENRGQFEMNCPSATGTVLSREQIEPISFRWGVVREEYTIGVKGCNKNVTYVVVCPDNGSGGCVATGDGTVN